MKTDDTKQDKDNALKTEGDSVQTVVMPQGDKRYHKKTVWELWLDVKYEILKDLEILAMSITNGISKKTNKCEAERRRCKEWRMMRY